MGISKMKNKLDEPVLHVALLNGCEMLVKPEEDEVSIIDSRGGTVFYMKYDPSVVDNTSNGVAIGTTYNDNGEIICQSFNNLNRKSNQLEVMFHDVSLPDETRREPIIKYI